MNEPRKLYVKSFGCQMNVYDSRRMADTLMAHNYVDTARAEDADLIILNTCHIREKAADKVYSELGRVRRMKETAKAEGRRLVVAVAGCVAQAEGEEIIRRAPAVDLVIGPQSYHRLPDLLARAERDGKAIDTEFPVDGKFDHLAAPSLAATRARGVSAHTMHLRDGASALRVLADRVAALEDLTDLSQGTLVNVGVLNAGDARQVVPASAEMHVDLRARNDSAAAALLSRVLGILRAPCDPRVTLEFSGGITRPAFPQAASAALLSEASRAAASLGIPYPAVESGGGSDGSFAAALGRPTLDGLGPICIDPCSRRERIVIDSLFDRAAILGSLMANLPGPAAPHSIGDVSWV